MKLLTYTSLYPDSTRPGHGIFVETRLRHLLADGNIQSRVVAPVPWFPSIHPRFGEYARYASVPREEMWHGIRVSHPRYPLVPKWGMTSAPWTMAWFTYAHLRRIIRDGYDFDVIDAHYFYPDGVAAALLGKALNKPVVITARGTDLNLIPQHYLPRRMIQWAAGRAAGLITVCQALKDVLVDLGVDANRITVLRNGVDLVLFKPSDDRAGLRARLGIHATMLLSVGNLIPLKGHDLTIRSLLHVPEAELFIAGDGTERHRLRQLAQDLCLSERVRFLGAVDQSQLADYYRAADILVLASSREGWANVLLESLACGTPVVATKVGGTAEVICSPEAGRLADRTAESLAREIRYLLDHYPARNSTRRYAERYGWYETVKGLQTVFAGVCGYT